MFDRIDYGLMSIVNMFLLRCFEEIISQTNMVLKLIPGGVDASKYFKIMLWEEKRIDELNLSLRLSILEDGGYVTDIMTPDFKISAVLTHDDFATEKESQLFRIGLMDNPKITKVRQKGSQRIKYAFKSTLYDYSESSVLLDKWENIYVSNEPFYRIECEFNENDSWTVMIINLINAFQVDIISMHSFPEKNSFICTEQSLFL